MTCGEFENVLPEYLEGGHSLEQQAHLKSCAVCADLVADLNLISSQAVLLRESDEPSPRVWNSIEAQLRREGLIHAPVTARPSWHESLLRWRNAWLIPVTAAMIITGLKLYHPSTAGDREAVVARQKPAPTPQVQKASAEDTVILNTVAARPPAQRASYEADLNSANAYIRDLEQSVRNDPSDLYNRQLLINAYEEKQMLYDLAIDRGMGEQ